MQDQNFMRLMSFLPKSALSTAVGWLTRLSAPPALHQRAMRRFARAYQINLDEAEHPIEDYKKFSDFFSRKLKTGLRTLEGGSNVVVSPVDGALSRAAYVDNGQCIQAKGVSFPLEKLLMDAKQAQCFEGGAYATIYLAPRDYHRIHAPLGGTIEGFAYIPGEFWPVNAASVRLKDALFCINERLITYLNTPLGRCAVVKVGATCVSRIRASYTDRVTHTGGKQAHHTFETPLKIEKGDELGAFEMGSTVVMVFEPSSFRWDETLQPDQPVQWGNRLGQGAVK